MKRASACIGGKNPISFERDLLQTTSGCEEGAVYPSENGFYSLDRPEKLYLILEDDCQLNLILDAVCDIEGNRLFDQHDDGLPSQPMPAITKRDTEWPLLQYSEQPAQPVKVRQAGK